MAKYLLRSIRHITPLTARSASTTTTDNAVVTALRQMITDKLATYCSPTTDHTYKKVILNDDEISLDFCNALLKISIPNVPLSARKVEVMSENIEVVFKNVQMLLRNANDQQNTKVDALFCADINDERKTQKLMQTRKNTQIQKPAYILGEMQVKEQNFWHMIAIVYGQNNE